MTLQVVKVFSGALAHWRSGLAIAAINGYQRWISPHKGFRCAHRVLHGGTSCSQFVKETIATRPWPEAWHLSRLRFAACSRASRKLRRLRSQLSEGTSAAPAEEDPKLWRRQQRRSQPGACDRSYWSECCLSGALEGCCALTPDCGDLGADFLDCGDCGCSG